MILQTHDSLRKEQFWVIGLIVLCILIPSFAWYTTSTQLEETHNMVDTLHETCLNLKRSATHQENNRLLISTYRSKDPLFLQRYIETYPLLQKELQALSSDMVSSCLPIPRERKDRISFLNSPDNRLSFFEGRVHQSPLLKETLEVQSKPIEMDQSDLDYILTLIDGPVNPHLDEKLQEILAQRPFLLPEHIEIERKTRASQEVWLVKCRILKREFSPGVDRK